MGLFRKHTSYQTTDEAVPADYAAYQVVEQASPGQVAEPAVQTAYEMAQVETPAQPVAQVAPTAEPRLIVDVIAPWDIAKLAQQSSPAQVPLSVERPVTIDSPVPVAVGAMPAYQ